GPKGSRGAGTTLQGAVRGAVQSPSPVRHPTTPGRAEERPAARAGQRFRHAGMDVGPGAGSAACTRDRSATVSGGSIGHGRDAEPTKPRPRGVDRELRAGALARGARVVL